MLRSTRDLMSGDNSPFSNIMKTNNGLKGEALRAFSCREKKGGEWKKKVFDNNTAVIRPFFSQFLFFFSSLSSFADVF